MSEIEYVCLWSIYSQSYLIMEFHVIKILIWLFLLYWLNFFYLIPPHPKRNVFTLKFRQLKMEWKQFLICNCVIYLFIFCSVYCSAINTMSFELISYFESFQFFYFALKLLTLRLNDFEITISPKKINSFFTSQLKIVKIGFYTTIINYFFLF